MSWVMSAALAGQIRKGSAKWQVSYHRGLSKQFGSVWLPFLLNIWIQKCRVCMPLAKEIFYIWLDRGRVCIPEAGWFKERRGKMKGERKERRVWY